MEALGLDWREYQEQLIEARRERMGCDGMGQLRCNIRFLGGVLIDSLVITGIAMVVVRCYEVGVNRVLEAVK